MLSELRLPSFNTLIHNCKVSFANRVAVCDNAVVRCVLPFKQWSAGCVVVRFYPSLSVCLFFMFVCVGLVYGPCCLKQMNEWMICWSVSYVDDCRNKDATTTHLNAETDGYLAVFPQQRSHHPSPQRCPWVLTVNTGRRINITWRVSPTSIRYIPPGVSLPVDGRGTHRADEPPCSIQLTFTEPDRDPVEWTCRRQDTTPVDRTVQVHISSSTSYISLQQTPAFKSLLLPS